MGKAYVGGDLARRVFWLVVVGVGLEIAMMTLIIR